MQQQNATKEVAYRVNSMLQLLDIFQSTILNEELSINNIISYKKNTDSFTKTPYFKQKFRIYRKTKKFVDNIHFSTLSINTERI